MIPRRLLPDVTSALVEVPAVALLGPRQAGKTTLALEIASTRPSLYLDFESESDRAKLVEPELYLAQHDGELVTDALFGATDMDELLRMPHAVRATAVAA